ncbi:MAG: hypothetical protein SGILL_007119, partial [Bacillariaceae sp.]
GFIVQDLDDGLNAAVAALPPSFTSRYGEVVWAHYSGFGWWPSFIYDPRHTVGSARDLARKNLGKRHLVYFFECHDAPFTVLTNQKLKKWEEGLLEDLHLGKTAKARFKIFQQALQAATLELAKPVEMRMDWNHSELPQTLPSPQKKPAILPSKKRIRASSISSSDQDRKHKRKKRKHIKPRGFPLLSSSLTIKDAPQVPTKRNLIGALQAVEIQVQRPGNGNRIGGRRANAIVELMEDGDLFIKLLQKPGLPQVTLEDDGSGNASLSTEDDGQDNDYHNNHDNASSSTYTNVGFIKLSSRKTSSFADARKSIQNELVPDSIQPNSKWRFHVPGLGPVSRKQEDTMGPMLAFLQRTTLNVNLGDGTLLNPLKVFMVVDL